MDCLIAFGFVSLGSFVGLLVGWCVNAEKEPDTKSYGAIIAAGAGGVASFVPFFSPLTTREVWLYPISLFAGLLLAPIFDVAYTWFYTWPKVSATFKKYEELYLARKKSSRKSN